MSRKNLDDIFRDGLKNYNSDIDPNEIWAGIQDKQSTLDGADSDDSKPFPWWIIGTLLIAFSATVLLCNYAYHQDNVIETMDARVTNVVDQNVVYNKIDRLNATQKETKDALLPNVTNTAVENKTNSVVTKVQHTDATTTKNTHIIGEKKSEKSTQNLSKSNVVNEVNIQQAIRDRNSSSVTNTVGTNNVPPIQTTTISNSTTNLNQSIPAYYNPTFTIPFTNTNSTKSTLNKSKLFAFETIKTIEAIPVIPTTVDTENNDAITEIPDFRIPKEAVAKAKAKYRGKPFSFAVGAHIAPDLVNHRISANNEDLFPYIDERRKTEMLLESFHIGLDAYVKHRDGLFLRSGIEYAQINRRFTFNETWTEIDTSANTITTFEREKKTTNRYRLVDIPLTVGYEFEVNNWDLSLYIEAGAAMNLFLSTKGDILNPNSPSDFYEPISITNGAANSLDAYVDNVGLSILGGIGLRKDINSEFSAYVQPSGKLYINSFIRDGEFPIDERFSRFGINLGVLYKL